ncbi:hypothetical protein [Thalassoroseus pseudoceratinae]|uniref:hypothetical protein n=1 Tax=Thalassoroseus pseudoceratinae TaxID=2713176 RepID=UPI0014239220|nr:hypothetical protein [Thalassoroseus pseudoceratinae]
MTDPALKPESQPTFSVRWVAASVGMLAFLVFLPTVNYDFVNWDDPWYVINNELIENWSLENLHGIATESVARNYAPLTIFSFLVDRTFWGLNPTGFHLTNVLLHTINAVLVFYLVRQLTGRWRLAWAVAAVFAVHPLQIETVAWISSRKGLLSGAFMLASLLCWLRPERTGKHEAWGIIFLAAALFSKALAVVLPAIVLSYDLFVRRQKFAEAFPRQIIPGCLSLWVLGVTMGAQTTIVGGTRAHFDLSRWELLAVDATILWQYVGMLAWPTDLCVLYDPPTRNILLPAVCAVIGWMAVAVWAWRNRDSHSDLLFAFVCWVLLLIPVMNLFPLTTLMNDRYLYLPCIPVLTVAFAGVRVGWLKLVSMTESGESMRIVTRVSGAMAVGCVILAATLATQQRLPVWRNGMTLWSDAIEKTPTLTVVRIQWANTLQAAGHTEEACNVLRGALVETAPDEINTRRIREKLEAWSDRPDDSQVTLRKPTPHRG